MIEIARTTDIAACHSLRRQVFIEEQGVSEEEEVDGLDNEAIHILARQEGRPIGCARILLHGSTAKIGRVCILREARGTGLGAALMQKVVEECRLIPGITKAKLGAQIHALGFYERLGFTAFGPEYLDAGIAHRDMELAL